MSDDWDGARASRSVGNHSPNRGLGWLAGCGAIVVVLIIVVVFLLISANAPQPKHQPEQTQTPTQQQAAPPPFFGSTRCADLGKESQGAGLKEGGRVILFQTNFGGHTVAWSPDGKDCSNQFQDIGNDKFQGTVKGHQITVTINKNGTISVDE